MTVSYMDTAKQEYDAWYNSDYIWKIIWEKNVMCSINFISFEVFGDPISTRLSFLFLL